MLVISMGRPSQVFLRQWAFAVESRMLDQHQRGYKHVLQKKKLATGVTDPRSEIPDAEAD